MTEQADGCSNEVVLVCLGSRNREVTFLSDNPTHDVRALEEAVRKAFKDVKTVTACSQLIFQVCVHLCHAERHARTCSGKITFSCTQKP